MTITERAEFAVYKNRSGYNCCQAVTLALADLTGLSEEQIISAATGFGGGMGNMEGSCGALVGAVLVAGLCGKGRSARKIHEAFIRDAGAPICKTIKGVETGEVLTSCADCVKIAVLAFGEALGLE